MIRLALFMLLSSVCMHSMHIDIRLENRQVICSNCKKNFQGITAYLAHKAASNACKKSIGQLVVEQGEKKP